MEYIQNYIICSTKELMNSVVIVAGGKGTRLKGKIPKQFIKLGNNKSILNICVEAFLKNKLIDELVIVAHSEWVEKIKNEFKQCKVVSGGSTRSHSSLNGLKKCSKNCKNVLIHDAARPFVSQKIITECFEMLKKYDAVVPVIRPSDSITYKNKEAISYLDRDKVQLVQTPQAFKFNKIIKAYKNNQYGTDDLSVLINENPNISRFFIKGDMLNFKITNKSDLNIAKRIYELQS